MRGVACYAVAYDVSDDGERARVDKVLLGFGMRVQKSVFECRLSRAMRERLMQELQELKLATGHVLIYQVQANSPAIAIGCGAVRADTGMAFIV